MSKKKPPLFVVAGPTACGKTSAAIALAHQINGAVISADSMQVYRGMDIGTAKPTLAEREGVPHYMIDEFAPNEPFSAAIFVKMASAYARQIYAAGQIPILTGGTGFYINAFLTANPFDEGLPDTDYREWLALEAQARGADWLYEQLRAIDPAYADTTHPNNVKRVIRALEYHHQTGGCLSEKNLREKRRTPDYDVENGFFVLSRGRANLYEAIDRRVDEMVASGLVAEVAALLAKGYAPGLVSMQGLGYKEIVSHLAGGVPLAEAIDTVKRGTRRFAKRQLTWFRGQCPQAVWLDMDTLTPSAAAAQMACAANAPGTWVSTE